MAIYGHGARKGTEELKPWVSDAASKNLRRRDEEERRGRVGCRFISPSSALRGFEDSPEVAEHAILRKKATDRIRVWPWPSPSSTPRRPNRGCSRIAVPHPPGSQES